MANGEDFLCGVVEGFYSRPWSVDQRLDLYEKMEKYRLNTYVCTYYLKNYIYLKPNFNTVNIKEVCDKAV